jgi:hypothetical protein
MHTKPVRYQNQRCLHFITFSCYRCLKLLDSAAVRDAFEVELERVRRWYGCYLTGYVVTARRRERLAVVPTAPTAHPPAKNAGRVGQP